MKKLFKDEKIQKIIKRVSKYYGGDEKLSLDMLINTIICDYPLNSDSDSDEILLEFEAAANIIAIENDDAPLPPKDIWDLTIDAINSAITITDLGNYRQKVAIPLKYLYGALDNLGSYCILDIITHGGPQYMYKDSNNLYINTYNHERSISDLAFNIVGYNEELPLLTDDQTKRFIKHTSQGSKESIFD
jgi:hypothetical protein